MWPVDQGGMTGKLFFCPLFSLLANDESLDCRDVRKSFGKGHQRKGSRCITVTKFLLSRASPTFCSGLENLHSQQALSSSSHRCALAHFNLSSCLSGTSATHQKATLPLLCFHKLLMLLNLFFFFSF